MRHDLYPLIATPVFSGVGKKKGILVDTRATSRWEMRRAISILEDKLEYKEKDPNI